MALRRAVLVLGLAWVGCGGEPAASDDAGTGGGAQQTAGGTAADGGGSPNGGGAGGASAAGGGDGSGGGAVGGGSSAGGGSAVGGGSVGGGTVGGGAAQGGGTSAGGGIASGGGTAGDAGRDAGGPDAGRDAGADAGLIDGGRLIFFASFQDGGIPSVVSVPDGGIASYVGRDVCGPDSLTVVPAPWDGGRYALRALSRLGDSWHDAGYPRSEIYPYTGGPAFSKFAFHSRYRITTAFEIESGTILPTTSPQHPNVGEIAIFQIHADDAVSPVLAGQVHNGTLQVGVLPDPSMPWQITVVGPCPLGRRVPVEIVYQPSADADGYLQVRIDGQVLIDRSGPNHVGTRVNNPTGGYWKQGIYDYWRGIGALPGTADDELSVFIDDLSIYR